MVLRLSPHPSPSIRLPGFGTKGIWGGIAPEGISDPEPRLSVEVSDIRPSQASEIKREAGVVGLAPVIPMRLIDAFSKSSVITPAGGSVAWGVKAVGADVSGCSGQGVTVAVIDTGIKRDHPAFSNLQIETEDFTNTVDTDTNGHGTHCAGTIAGGDVAGLRIGVARQIKKLLVGKVIGGNSSNSGTLVQAILWALKNGANVISMSLGIDYPGYVQSMTDRGIRPDVATSTALAGYRENVLLFERLASLLRAQAVLTQPCLIIAAGGNESGRDAIPPYTIGIGPPAVSEGIISVAALGESEGGLKVAPFSNTGATLAAPGVAVISAALSDVLCSMSGTSMATPHVAGVAALWAEDLMQRGLFTSENLAAKLRATAATTGLLDRAPDDVGAGLVKSP